MHCVHLQLVRKHVIAVSNARGTCVHALLYQPHSLKSNLKGLSFYSFCLHRLQNLQRIYAFRCVPSHRTEIGGLKQCFENWTFHQAGERGLGLRNLISKTLPHCEMVTFSIEISLSMECSNLEHIQYSS